MPAGCVYFVSFYITRYPRDLDSIYFLLALRLECTSPIFDVGGRIFSGRNDRWIFLYFHSPFSRLPPPPPSRPLLRFLFLFPILFPSGTLASFNRDITLHTSTANYQSQNNAKFNLPGGTRELRWIPIRAVFVCTFSQTEFRFFPPFSFIYLSAWLYIRLIYVRSVIHTRDELILIFE